MKLSAQNFHKKTEQGIAHILAIVVIAAVVAAGTYLYKNDALKLFEDGDVLQASAGTTYYIATNGKDSNPGTQNQPWATIEYALNYSGLKPGDTILVRGGTYQEGDLVFNEGPQGENGNYITLKNYPGEIPLFRSTAIKIRARDYMRIEGLHFENLLTTTIGFEARFRPIKGVQIVNNVMTNNTKTKDLTFIRVSNWGGNTEPDLYLRTQDVLIQGNQLNDDNSDLVDDDKADALQIGGNVDYLRIINNTLTSPRSIGITIAGRIWKNDPKDPKDADDINPAQADYFVVKGNTISDGIGNSFGIYLDAPGNNFIVEDNVVRDMDGGGIKIAGEKVTTDLNYYYGIVRRNVLDNNFINLNVGSKSQASGADITNCSQTIDVNEIAVAHNTIYRDAGTKFGIRIYCVDGLFFKNNLVLDSSTANNNFIFDNPFNFTNTSSWEFNNNQYFTGANTKTFRLGGADYETLPAFAAATGKDQNSSLGNPALQNPNSANFGLSSGSTAIDAGGYLTQTKGAGNGNIITVENSKYFSDGFKIQAGDLIRIGDDVVRITAVNYGNNQLTVDKSISWNNNESVNYDYAGNGPDLGAIESGYSNNTPPPQPDPTPGPICGDAVCSDGETCSSCSIDCGTCPITPPTGETKTYTVKKISATPVIDGDLTEYENAETIKLTTPVTNLTATYRVVWDDNALYFAAQANDTTLNATHTAKDSPLWEDDAFELVFDTLNNKNLQIDGNDYKFLVNILNTVRDEKGGSAAWNSASSSEAKTIGTIANNTDTDGEYKIELKIPWEVFETKPTNDTVWGMDIGVKDAYSESNRDQAIWNNSDGGSINQPNGWGNLIFSTEIVNSGDSSNTGSGDDNSQGIEGKHEAEDAIYGDTDGNGISVVESNHSGYSGSGFVNLSDAPNGKGGFVNWIVYAPEDGKYNVDFVYAFGNRGKRLMSLNVNGVDLNNMEFVTTGAWNNWASMSKEVDLVAGLNSIQIESVSVFGGPNIDYMNISKISAEPNPDPEPTPEPDPVPTPYCGDNICQVTESCSSCAVDCGVCIAEPKNLLPDPSFESNVSFYYIGRSNRKEVEFVVDENNARTGNKSIRIDSIPDKTIAGWETRRKLVPVEAGKTYQIKAWSKTNGADALGQIYYQFQNSNATYIGVDNAINFTATQNNWQENTLNTSKAPAGTGFIAIYFRIIGTGSINYDDISLVEL